MGLSSKTKRARKRAQKLKAETPDAREKRLKEQRERSYNYYRQLSPSARLIKSKTYRKRAQQARKSSADKKQSLHKLATVKSQKRIKRKFESPSSCSARPDQMRENAAIVRELKSPGSRNALLKQMRESILEQMRQHTETVPKLESPLTHTARLEEMRELAAGSHAIYISPELCSHGIYDMRSQSLVPQQLFICSDSTFGEEISQVPDMRCTLTMESGTENEDGYVAEIINGGHGMIKRKRKQYRPKIKDTWTDEDIVKLIGEVENCPCIWNTGIEENKNRRKRESAWNRIAVAFHNTIEVEQLSGKWQSLRSTYRHARKNTSGQWKFYKLMQFLDVVEQEQSVYSDSNLFLSEVLDESVETDSPTPSRSGIVQNNYRNVNNNTERDEFIISEMKAAISPADDVEIFANYLASNLRKIKNNWHREQTQRQLLQLVWKSIDIEPSNTNNLPELNN